MRFFHFAFLLFSKGGRHFSLFFFGSISEAEWPKEKHQRETLRVNRTRPHTHTHTQAQLPLCSLLSGEREREREVCAVCIWVSVRALFWPEITKGIAFCTNTVTNMKYKSNDWKKEKKEKRNKIAFVRFFLFSFLFSFFSVKRLLRHFANRIPKVLFSISFCMSPPQV